MTYADTQIVALLQQVLLYTNILTAANFEIQSRIAGQTPGSPAQNLYSTRDNGTPAYVRSSTWFGHDIDLTGIAAWSSDGVKVCALIAPDIAITAAHYGLGPTNPVRFVAANGAVTTLIVSSVATVHDSVNNVDTDIQVIRFTGSAPATIKPLPIFDQNSLNSLAGALAFWIDQNQVGYTAQFTRVEADNFLAIADPSDAFAATFYRDPIVGDSGHPVMIVLDGQAILLGTFFGDVAIPSLGGVQSAGDITTTIQGLGSASVPTIFSYRNQ